MKTKLEIGLQAAGDQFAKRDLAKADGVGLRKSDDELQIVWGEVYAPNFPDSQGDFMGAEAIRKMAYRFMSQGRVSKIDVGHNEIESGSVVVESFIARENDPDFIPGSWVIGVHIPDTELWGMVKSGELNGFSFGGSGVKKDTAIEIELPDEITGGTDEVDGHTHTFTVKFDPAGNVVHGVTDPGPDGHIHTIKSGTLTEAANGHRHRFSFVEGVLGNG